MTENNKTQFDEMVQTIMNAPITQEGINIVCETFDKMLGLSNADEKFCQSLCVVWGGGRGFSEKIMASHMMKEIMDIPLTAEGCKGTSYNPKDGAKQILKIWQQMHEDKLFAPTKTSLERWYVIAKKVEAAAKIPAQDVEPSDDEMWWGRKRAERLRKENS